MDLQEREKLRMILGKRERVGHIKKAVKIERIKTFTKEPRFFRSPCLA